MAVDLMSTDHIYRLGNPSLEPKIEDTAVVQEAAAGLDGIQRLIKVLSHHDHRYQISSPSSNSMNLNMDMDMNMDGRVAVSKLKKVISQLGRTRTGHARFRSAPLVVSPPHGIEGKVYFDLNTDEVTEKSISSMTGTDRENEQLSSFQNRDLVRVSSAAKPPLSSSSLKRTCSSEMLGSGKCGLSGRCHCSKKRKLRVKKVIRVPAISLKIAEIPSDDYSWRKYGQKTIKGSPHPRGYYKCSSVRGCPARKHVEKACDDPSMVVVTYEDHHDHDHHQINDCFRARNSC